MRCLAFSLAVFLATILTICSAHFVTDTKSLTPVSGNHLSAHTDTRRYLSSSSDPVCPNDPLTYNIQLNAGTWTSWHPYGSVDDNSTNVIGKPVTLYYVLRHGARYPTSVESEDINHLRSKVRSIFDTLPESCFKEMYLNYFINRFPGFPIDIDGELVNDGIQTNINFGMQFAKTFSETIFNKETRKYPTPNKSYGMVSSSSPRSIQSGITFFNSLLSTISGEHSSSFIITTTDTQEQLLHQNKYCPKFSNYTDSQKAETKSFEHRMITPVLQRFLHRLGLDSNSTGFTTTDLNNLWNACTYSLTVYDKEFSHANAHFCNIFSDDDVDIMSHVKDSSMYFTYGYGSSNPISYEQALPLLSDIITKLTSSVDDVKHGKLPTVYGGFGHVETNIPLYTLLQLFQETDESQKLSLSDTPYDVAAKKSRLWKLKDFGTFSTNIAFILTIDSLNQFYVSLYVNETYLPVPLCGGAYSCPFDAFVSIYSKLYDGLLRKSLSELCTA